MDEKKRDSFWQRLRKLFRRKPKSPEDPYADRPVRVRRGPPGRSGAAVAEPERDDFHWFPPRRS